MSTQTSKTMAVAGEAQYLDLVKHVLETGEEREGRNGKTKSVFGTRLEFSLKNGFPLLTTKRVFWRGVVAELLWFLRGSTDVFELALEGVNIWNANSTRAYLDSVGLKDTEAGFIGAGYGHQWRNFGGDYPTSQESTKGTDQLRYILSELSSKPHGRRAVLSAWNPLQQDMMALPPCHMLYQFYANKNGLSCQLVTRSQDLLLGTPFNIASAALLTHIIAHVLDLQVDRLVLIGGDVHVYDEHIAGALEQIERVPFKSPKLRIKKEASCANVDEMVTFIEGLCFKDFEIQDYNHHPSIDMKMIA